MPAIGLSFEELMAQLVVEIIDIVGIGSPTFGRGHTFHRMIFPQSTLVSEGGKTTFCAHPSTSEYH